MHHNTPHLLETIPVHSPVIVTPAEDATAVCSMRIGGEAPISLQSPGCGQFADWELYPGRIDGDRVVPAGPEPELNSCGRHLPLGVRYLSDQMDAQRRDAAKGGPR